MMDSGRSDLLDEIASFSSCTRTELDLLSFIATETFVSSGTVVTVENTTGRECFVISSGSAKVTRDGEDLGMIGAGEFFGELSLLAGSAYPTTVTAETPMELYVLSPAEFDSLLANAPTIVRKMLRERRRVVA